VVLIAVAWLVFNQVTVANWVPNTVSAKRYFFGAYAYPASWTLLIIVSRVFELVTFIGPAIIGVFLAIRVPQDRVLVVAFLVQLLAIGVSSSVSLNHNYFRYLHPILIPAVLGGLTTLCSAPPYSRLNLVAPVVLLAALTWTLCQAPFHWMDYRNGQTIVGSQAQIAAWVTAHNDGHPVLLHDAGYLSEFTTLPLVDLVGLKTSAAVDLNRTITGPSAGRDRGLAEHALACTTNPTYFVALTIWEDVFRVSAGLQEQGWQLLPMFKTTAFDRIWGRVGYTVYRLKRSPRCVD
jgi:hypothetical protein